MARAREPAHELRIVLAVGDPATAADLRRILVGRGLAVELAAVGAGASAAELALALRLAVDSGAVAAGVLSAPLDGPGAARLAALGNAAAAAGRPLVLLTPPGRGPGKGVERAAALAWVRAAGAVVSGDPDCWLEAAVLIAGHGMPAGPRAAIVAPPGSWIEAQALALAVEAEVGGGRAPALARATSDVEPVDVVLVDRAALPERDPTAAGGALVVPVIGRGELASGDRVPLVGLRAALAAVTAVGRAAARIAAGPGPAPRALSGELDSDPERIRRQLDKLDARDGRAGDHETKVLLAAYGVAITRQAVATTPSAATRLAKKAGFPVELKPWGPSAPSERDGGTVERDLATAADVRRAYAALASAAARPGELAVIVRETPPPGREVAARVLEIAALGWTVVVDLPGTAAPLAAPAPLREVDAIALAAALVASRAGEPEPDRGALAEILRRASHLAVDQEAALTSLELGRIVVGARGGRTLVVDAEAGLRGR